MAALREGQRRRVLLPPAHAAGVPMIMRRGRDRERTHLPALLLLLGASVIVGSTSSSSASGGDYVLAGFLLWLLGVVLLSFHRAPQRLGRFFAGHLLLV